MGVLSISTFNSVVYVALNYTQVINAVLVLAAIPAATIVISSIMKVDKTNYFQIFGLILSIFGIGYIISNGEFERITSLNFNVGDLWMLVCVLTWSLFSKILKKYKFKFSQFFLLHLMVSVGILFLIPQYFYEQSIGLEVKYNKTFLLILFYVVIFPAIAAYYCWQKGVSILGPNKATMFVQLMPLFSVVMAIIIFNEKFELYHFAGATFILTGIYLSNKKSMIKVAVLDDYQNAFQQIVEIEKYKDKFHFKVFNEPFLDEKEAIVELDDFEALFLMRERTPMTKDLIESLPKLKYIMTSGMRNKAIDLITAKKKI